MNGVVSFTVDPDTSVSTGAQFVGYLAGMGVTHIKAPIRTSAAGALPTDLYSSAITAHQKAGIAVLPLFDRAFRPVGGETPTTYPNMALNTSGDRLLSPWIDGYTLRASGFLRQLHQRCGITRAICWNEADLSALLAPGVNLDPAGEKANALSPQVFAALCWQAAHRWKQAGIEQVYCGGFNIIPQTGTDAANPYVGQYMTKMYASLMQHGHKAPWPWAGWSITAEGFWTASHFAAEIAAIRKVMTVHGDTGEIIVTEWGTPNPDLAAHPEQAVPTYAAITGICPEVYFYSGPGATPYLADPAAYPGYGAYSWRNTGNVFTAGPDYRWGLVLRQLFATP